VFTSLRCRSLRPEAGQLHTRRLASGAGAGHRALPGQSVKRFYFRALRLSPTPRYTEFLEAVGSLRDPIAGQSGLQTWIDPAQASVRANRPQIFSATLASFWYQSQSWNESRQVVANVSGIQASCTRASLYRRHLLALRGRRCASTRAHVLEYIKKQNAIKWTACMPGLRRHAVRLHSTRWPTTWQRLRRWRCRDGRAVVDETPCSEKLIKSVRIGEPCAT